jgi:uncharacterized protein
MEEIIDLIKNGKNTELNQRLIKSPSIALNKTNQGISLLQLAAYCKNKFAIDVLKRLTTKLNIYEATCIGDEKSVTLLLHQDPLLLNSFSPDGFTLLGLASYFGYLQIVNLLLEKGADPNIKSNNSYQVNPIHSASAISNCDIVEALLKNGADVNAKQMLGITAMHTAAHNGNTLLLELLIKYGADVNVLTDSGQSPLLMAEKEGFKEVSQLLHKYA